MSKIYALGLGKENSQNCFSYRCGLKERGLPRTWFPRRLLALPVHQAEKVWILQYLIS